MKFNFTLNMENLSAAEFSSLNVSKSLLCTFIAFDYCLIYLKTHLLSRNYSFRKKQIKKDSEAVFLNNPPKCRILLLTPSHARWATARMLLPSADCVAARHPHTNIGIPFKVTVGSKITRLAIRGCTYYIPEPINGQINACHPERSRGIP